MKMRSQSFNSFVQLPQGHAWNVCGGTDVRSLGYEVSGHDFHQMQAKYVGGSGPIKRRDSSGDLGTQISAQCIPVQINMLPRTLLFSVSEA